MAIAYMGDACRICHRVYCLFSRIRIKVFYKVAGGG